MTTPIAQGPVDVNVRGWMPIETAPANTWILTFAKWDSGRSVGISLFKDVERVVEKVESECHNRKGRRRVVQEETVTEREWEGDHWEPTHWMPLPDAPNVEFRPLDAASSRPVAPGTPG